MKFVHLYPFYGKKIFPAFIVVEMPGPPAFVSPGKHIKEALKQVVPGILPGVERQREG